MHEHKGMYHFHLSNSCFWNVMMMKGHTVSMNLRTERKRQLKNIVFFVRATYKHVVFAPANLILKQCKFSAIVPRVIVSFFVAQVLLIKLWYIMIVMQASWSLRTDVLVSAHDINLFRSWTYGQNVWSQSMYVFLYVWCLLPCTHLGCWVPK
jgi:hypothetical protein